MVINKIIGHSLAAIATTAMVLFSAQIYAHGSGGGVWSTGQGGVARDGSGACLHAVGGHVSDQCGGSMMAT